MSQTVSLGAQDFAYIRENNCFFVDKTDFIREWWENKDSVTLITRPRRFGKTLNIGVVIVQATLYCSQGADCCSADDVILQLAKYSRTGNAQMIIAVTERTL